MITDAECLEHRCYACGAEPGQKCRSMGRTYGTRGLAKNKGRLTHPHLSRENQVRRIKGWFVKE